MFLRYVFYDEFSVTGLSEVMYQRLGRLRFTVNVISLLLTRVKYPNLLISAITIDANYVKGRVLTVCVLIISSLTLQNIYYYLI